MTAGVVYREGAHKGLLMGLYLSILFFTMVFSDRLPLLAVISFAQLVGVPFFTYKLMNATNKKYHRTGDFPSLWMLGIAIFIGGSLICGLVTYSYLQYVEPDYFYRMMQNAIDTYTSIPEFKNSELVDLLNKAIEKEMLPTPIQFSIEMLWNTTFFGSLLSMILAAIIKRRNGKQK